MKTSTFYIFSIRLDEKTAANLAELAASDERKRGDYVRILIRREAEKLPKAKAAVKDAQG